MSDASPTRRRVRLVVDDLFFSTRIATAARHAGVDVVRDGAADLVIVDLHARGAMDAIRELKAAAPGSAPVVGFLSHVAVELRDQALAAGADLVLPRSAFTAKLPEILAGRLQG